MIPGLGTFLDRLDSLVGKNYLIVGFVPILVFTVISFWVLYLLIPGTVVEFYKNISSEASMGKTVSLIGLGFILALLGYLLWGLNATFRELLEGRYLPYRARRWLEAQQQVARSKLDKQLASLRPDRVQYREVAGLDLYDAVDHPDGDRIKERQWVNRLASARKNGSHARPANALEQDQKLPERLTSLSKELRTARKRRRLIPFSKSKELFELLETELRNSATKALSTDNERTLFSVAAEFPEIARYALARIESDYNRMWSQRFFRFPNDSNTLGPTAMANMAELHRSYGKQRYGMETDLIWPRMQALIAQDSAFSGLLDQSKLKLDFAVSMTAVCGIFSVLSVTPVALYSSSFYMVILAPGISVGLMVLFYLLSVRSYRVLGEVLRSAIDAFRFELLGKLCLKKPIDSELEKRVWENISLHMMLMGTEKLEFEHKDDQN